MARQALVALTVAFRAARRCSTVSRGSGEGLGAVMAPAVAIGGTVGRVVVAGAAMVGGGCTGAWLRRRPRREGRTALELRGGPVKGFAGSATGRGSCAAPAYRAAAEVGGRAGAAGGALPSSASVGGRMVTLADARVETGGEAGGLVPSSGGRTVAGRQPSTWSVAGEVGCGGRATGSTGVVGGAASGAGSMRTSTGAGKAA